MKCYDSTAKKNRPPPSPSAARHKWEGGPRVKGRTEPLPLAFGEEAG